MYKKLLVAVDFYSGGEKILERVATLASEWGAEIHLLHMVDEMNFCAQARGNEHSGEVTARRNVNSPACCRIPVRVVLQGWFVQ